MSDQASGGITAVIPAYNSESSIQQAVLSCLTAGVTEVVVVDDGSRDATGRLAARAGAKVVTQDNAGAAVARRTGVANASGEFVVLLDADDELLVDGIRESLALIRQGTAGIVGGAIVATSSMGGERVVKTWGRPITAETLLHAGFSPGAPGSFLWRREILDEAMGPSPEAVWPPYAEDYELLIRGSLISRIVQHDKHVLRYALDGGKSTLDPTRSFRCSEEIRKHYAHQLGIPIRGLSERQIRGRAQIRTAGAARIEGRTRDWVSHVVRGGLLDPAFVARLVYAGLRSRISGPLAKDGRHGLA